MTLDANQADSSTAQVVLPTGPVPTIMEQSSPPVETKQETTTEEKASVQVEETPSTEKKETKSEVKEEKQEAKTEEKPTPFHEHPRFKEIISENKGLKNANQQLAQRLEALEQKLSTPEKRNDLNWEEIEDEADREGLGVVLQKVYAKAIEDAKSEMSNTLSQRETYSTLSNALNTFKKDHTDFQELFDDGTLQAISEEHPLLNTPMAAYLFHTQEGRVNSLKEEFDKTMKAEVEKAKSEITKKYEDEIKEIKANHAAKKDIKIVEERSTPPGSSASTLKSNGRTTTQVLAERLKQRRASVGL